MQVTYALGVGMEGEDPAQDTPEARAKALKEAVDAAAKADVAVVVVGRYNKLESEGFDVKTMDLPAGQDELIAAVEKANPHTIVVLNTGDPVTMTKWIDKTPALLDMWYGGQEGGHALAAILFGDANPSGKLPVTLPKRYEDNPAAANYPGKNLEVNYAEGIYVGYRYYDTKNVEPQFPFGFGLSYTKFEYSDLKCGKSNSRARSRSVDFHRAMSATRAAAPAPKWWSFTCTTATRRSTGQSHELKGFQRVELQPGETKTVEFTGSRGAVVLGSGDKSVASRSRDIRNSGRSEFARHPPADTAEVGMIGISAYPVETQS